MLDSSGHVTNLRMNLFTKIQKKSAIVGVVGLGYVGLPLALRFAEVGFQVVGIDIDEKKVNQLNRGESYIGTISSHSLAKAVPQKFSATTDFSAAKNLDAIIVCVPTPLNKYREPDLSFVHATIDSLLPFLKKGQLLSLESTTYPGTTDEEVLPKIQSAGFHVGEDFYLAFSPEREDPGNPQFSTFTTPRICSGITASCLEAALALYGQAIETVVPVSSTRVAEMTKLLENIHRSVNIGLVNEMKMVCDKMGIDIHEVIRAAATKPFGFASYFPGPGVGGHCIPIDPFYLTWKAREFGVHTHFIELAGEINSQMPAWVVGKISEALNQQAKSIHGSQILILGIAYKKNVDDLRESPSVEVMDLLQDRGAQLAYSDPHIPVFPKMRKHHFELVHTPLTQMRLAEFDCVVLLTDHDQFDYDLILKSSKLIVDTRGKFIQPKPHIVRA